MKVIMCHFDFGSFDLIENHPNCISEKQAQIAMSFDIQNFVNKILKKSMVIEFCMHIKTTS